MPVICSKCGAEIWGATEAEIYVGVSVLCAACAKERYGADPETIKRAIEDWNVCLLDNVPKPN